MIRRRLQRVGRWLWAVLLMPWQVISRFAQQPLRYTWRFIGRLGLATRDILSWTVGESYLLLFKPLIVGFWRLLGRMGAATRRLFTIFVWRPFLFFSRPVTWAFWKFIWPAWSWLARRLQLFGRFIWRKTARRRTLYGRRLRSRWIVWLARWRYLSNGRHPRLPLRSSVPHACHCRLISS